MDKFFGYYGITIFWLLFIMANFNYWFRDGTFETYMIYCAMGNLWMWFDYKVNHEDKDDET